MKYLNATIELLLQNFKQVIGEDYEKYRNHVYRVFLNCVLIDTIKSNEEKYAIAAVFHDIGIWTNNTIDYLNPSIEEARRYLWQAGKQHWIDEIGLMIYWHHKTSGYKGEYAGTVETFRKADYIDVSLGLLTYGFDKKVIGINRKIFPNAGFHVFLVKKITKNLFRHPLNALPMFTK
jgi:hypothetical protein